MLFVRKYVYLCMLGYGRFFMSLLEVNEELFFYNLGGLALYFLKQIMQNGQCYTNILLYHKTFNPTA